MARTDPTIYMRIPEDLKEALDKAAAVNKRSLTAEVVARLQHSIETTPDWSRTFPRAAAALEAPTDRRFVDAVLTLQRLERLQAEDRVQALEAQVVQMDGQALQLQRDLALIDSQLDLIEESGDKRNAGALLKQRKQLSEFLLRIDAQSLTLRRALKDAREQLNPSLVGSASTTAVRQQAARRVRINKESE